MPIWDSYVQVTCRACNRSVQMDPNLVPAKCQDRLVCTKCGARGGDLNLIYYPLPEKVKRAENVISISERRLARRPKRPS